MKTPSKSIICCGFTPCIQRIIEFDSLEKEAVNRAHNISVGIGGKGANVARMIREQGSQPLLIEFAGGANGRLLEQMLECEGVEFQHVEVKGETRICQTLVEAGNPETTELVEEMPALSPDEWIRMESLFETIDWSGVCTASGKLPAGAPDDAYARIAKRVRDQGGRLILDTQGGALLKALAHNPFLVKINTDELLLTMGADDATEACRRVIGAGALSVLITNGSRPAFHMDEARTLEIIPPEIEAVNPVGSGDAVTAGIAVSLNIGDGIEDAIRNGMACGAANALNLISGTLLPEDVERLKPEVRISKR